MISSSCQLFYLPHMLFVPFFPASFWINKVLFSIPLQFYYWFISYALNVLKHFLQCTFPGDRLSWFLFVQKMSLSCLYYERIFLQDREFQVDRFFSFQYFKDFIPLPLVCIFSDEKSAFILCSFICLFFFLPAFKSFLFITLYHSTIYDMSWYSFLHVWVSLTFSVSYLERFWPFIFLNTFSGLHLTFLGTPITHMLDCLMLFH